MNRSLIFSIALRDRKPLLYGRSSAIGSEGIPSMPTMHPKSANNCNGAFKTKRTTSTMQHSGNSSCTRFSCASDTG